MTARINQEAMDEILLRWNWGRMDELRELLKPMLSITGPEPNKWQPKTRGGYDFEIFAERAGCLYGMVGGHARKWMPTGTCLCPGNNDHDLLRIPASPHAALIERARNYRSNEPYDGNAAEIIRDLITALEAAGEKP